MKIIAQRSAYACVKVNNKLINEIKSGLVLLVSFTHQDSIKEIDFMVNKIAKLRIFDDENGVMNKNIDEVNGEVLSISQFTLYADIKSGNRPSYAKALNRNDANILYETFNEKLSKVIPTKSGVFGANMELLITNLGPVTIILDSEKIL